MGKFEKYLMILVAITITTLILGNYNVSATEFIVGDDQGWDIPASLTMYSTWASQQKFSVGDVLGKFLFYLTLILFIYFH